MIIRSGHVHPRTFHGVKWRNTNAGRASQYIINKYRVLLTRAREGMVFWLPRGEDWDDSRSPAEIDTVAEFLIDCGVKQL